MPGQLNISCAQFPVTVHSVVPPRRKNSEHTHDTFRAKCPMILPFSHPQCIDRKCFQALFHTPMTLQPPPPILLYIRGINIFVGRRHYKNFSPRKFFQRKFHITKISRFTVFRILGCNYTPDRHHRGNNIVELSMTSSPLQVYHPQASNTSLTWMTMVAGYLLRSSAVSCGRSSQ